MLTHLREQYDVAIVVRQPWARWFRLLRRALAKMSRGSVEIYWSPFWAGLASRGARRAISLGSVDLVFCVGISPICALLSGTVKTVFISDATVAGLINYNPKFSALSSTYRTLANAVETKAVSQSIAAFYPSSWARDDAIRYHRACPDRAYLVNWGANLSAAHERTRPQYAGEQLRLLFVGVNWVSKGGSIAVEAVRILAAKGMRVRLDIIGSRPENPEFVDPSVTLHGFLDKNNTVDRDRIVQMYSTSHLLLFPTQFEALGIVSAEAASFGIPTIAFRTGGVAGNLVDGETGILLDPGSSPQVWADTIFELMSDSMRYTAMCDAAESWSRNRGNWATWARFVARLLDGKECKQEA